MYTFKDTIFLLNIVGKSCVKLGVSIESSLKNKTFSLFLFVCVCVQLHGFHQPSCWCWVFAPSRSMRLASMCGEGDWTLWPRTMSTAQNTDKETAQNKAKFHHACLKTATVSVKLDEAWTSSHRQSTKTSQICWLVCQPRQVFRHCQMRLWQLVFPWRQVFPYCPLLWRCLVLLKRQVFLHCLVLPRQLVFPWQQVFPYFPLRPRWPVFVRRQALLCPILLWWPKVVQRPAHLRWRYLSWQPTFPSRPLSTQWSVFVPRLHLSDWQEFLKTLTHVPASALELAKGLQIPTSGVVQRWGRPQRLFELLYQYQDLNIRSPARVHTRWTAGASTNSAHNLFLC